MPDTKLRFTPLDPRDEQFITRAQLSARWAGCGEKAIIKQIAPHQFVTHNAFQAMTNVDLSKFVQEAVDFVSDDS